MCCFQQPRLSVDLRLCLTGIIAEPLRSGGRRDDVACPVRRLAHTVGLMQELLDGRLHETRRLPVAARLPGPSARPEPRRLVCDGMTAMPDVSTTAGPVRAVDEYRGETCGETRAGLLAVGRDPTLVERRCDRAQDRDRPAAS